MSLYYQEKQNFRKPGIWLIVSAFILPVNGVLIYGLYQQLVVGEPWGSEPNSDITLIIVTLVVVYYHFLPFKKNSINFSNLLSWEVKSIKPIFGFGGFGLRITSKSKAFIVNGKNALFLKLKKDKQIVIDTINQEGLKAAMTKEWQRFEEY
jgi:hypothetical protein